MKVFTKMMCVMMVLLLSFTFVLGQSTNLEKIKANKSTTDLTVDTYDGVKPIANPNDAGSNVSFASSDPDKLVLFDNGPMITHPGGGFGGADASALQSVSGPALTTYGFGAQQTAGNSMADDFTVTGTWTLNTITFFSYQTGSTTTSTITGIYAQIWNGAPNAGGTVVWGNLTTNLLASTTFTNIYRSIETDFLASNRPIMEVVANVAGCELSSGTYWVQYQFTGSLASGPWAPPISIWDQGETGNALQNTSTGWAAAVSGTAPNTYAQGVPFIIEGTSGSAGNTVFFDDFESGITNWAVTGTWGITDQYSYSTSHSLTDSPGGNYIPNQETYSTMVSGVDLSDPAILSVDLSWWMIMDIENGNFDYLYVEVSDDNFATFIEIASFFGEDMLTPWVEYSYPLSVFLGSNNVKVRFHFSSDQGYEVDGCYIDDVTITTSDVDNAPPEIFFDAPFGYEGTAIEFLVEAELIDATGVASAEVIYTVDGVVQSNITGVNVGGNNWEFTIPQQDPGYQVDFVISAVDASPNANEAITDTARYIAGQYISYDNAQVDFYTSIAAPGGTAVLFELTNPSQLVTALIRNYTDQSQPPNDEMLVHIWSDGGGVPGADLITPILMMPEANLINTRAFTRVDLRPYAAQLSNIVGNVFIGYTVPSGIVLTTITQPGIGNHSFNSLDGSTWNALADDYHYRIIVGEGGTNPFDPPTNLTGPDAVTTGETINLEWDAPGGGGTIEELIYDNDVTTGAYSYNGYTMSTHMSPAGSCKVLSMKFYTTIQAGANDFNATLFEWAGSQPGLDIIYQENVTAVDDNWMEVDISSQNITFSGDFVVGFGSVNATTFLGYDAGLNNGRSWDFNNSSPSWSEWNEAYLIRAIVEYTDGTIAEIGTVNIQNPVSVKSAELSVHPTDYSAVTTVKPIGNLAASVKELVGYNVYRDGSMIDYTTETFYNDVILVSGIYQYFVTAVYENPAGESLPSNTITVDVLTSIEDVISNSTSIYPNPASNVVNIKSDYTINTIKVYNYSGQVISNELVDTKFFQFNTSKFNSGLYLFQIETNEGTITKRIIIE